MACHEKEEPTETLELINPKLYQLLMRYAAHNGKWAEYFLLVNTCYEIIKQIPRTPEACEQANIDDLLIDTLERLGKVVSDVLPGGAKEFSEYMPML